MVIDIHKVWQVFFWVVFCLVNAVPVASALADDSAVILMYHNVSDEAPAATSVSPITFKRHMQYLADNNFTVWPLFKTLNHLATGKTIPAKTVVLTFDDAYRSVYQQSFPVLKEKGWPFTVFVTTQYIGEGYTNYMNWQQLREIKKFGGEVGNHGLSHPHFVRKRKNETEAHWRERIIYEVQQSQDILQQNVGDPIRVVAYPYGEYSKQVKEIIRQLGYFGLGQHSGAISRDTDFQAIPRFPMATGFDDIENFAIKVAAKNLPVTVLSPDDGIVSAALAIPVLKLQLEAGDYKRSELRCYSTGQGQIKLEWSSEDETVVNVSANETIKPGRTKYNCTAPSATEEDVFYWYSFLWMKPESDGRWYRE